MSSDSARQSRRTFRVGLRAQTGLYFPKDEPLTLKNFPSVVGPIDLVFDVNRLEADGFDHPLRFGLWINVTGPAPSLDAAVETFGNVTRGMAAILAVAANTSIDDPTADIAIETTVGSERHEYWSREPLAYAWPHGFGRGILTQFPAALIEAYAKHPEQDRFHRAIVQYHHALQHWAPGEEIAALTHVWIGMEALTNIARARLRAELGLENLVAQYLTPDQAHRSDGQVNFNKLDAEIRRRQLFQGDDKTYTLAKKASDGYEHSFNPLWKVRDDALQALESAAGYLRHAILTYADMDERIKKALLDRLFQTPYGTALHLDLRGELTGPAETLAAIDFYPDIEWANEPFERGVDAEGDATIGNRMRFAVQGLPPGVTFKPTQMGIQTQPGMTEGTAVVSGTHKEDLTAHDRAAPWSDVSIDGRPGSAVEIRDLFTDTITTKMTGAMSFDDAVQYQVDTITMPTGSFDRDDLLDAAQRQVEQRQGEGWEPACLFPGADEHTFTVIYRRTRAEATNLD